MSGTTTKAEPTVYNVHDKTPKLPELICRRISEKGTFKGTVTELGKALKISMIPRILAAKLRRCESELENSGIHVGRKTVRGRRVLVIGYAANLSHNLTCTPTLSNSSLKEGASNINDYNGCYFAWEYAYIAKLSESEMLKVNRLRQHGKKEYRKPCSICGSNGGNLEFRKVSDGYPSLICKPCAEKYVRSAMKLQQQEDFKKDVI